MSRSVRHLCHAALIIGALASCNGPPPPHHSTLVGWWNLADDAFTQPTRSVVFDSDGRGSFYESYPASGVVISSFTWEAAEGELEIRRRDESGRIGALEKYRYFRLRDKAIVITPPLFKGSWKTEYTKFSIPASEAPTHPIPPFVD